MALYGTAYIPQSLQRNSCKCSGKTILKPIDGFILSFSKTASEQVHYTTKAKYLAIPTTNLFMKTKTMFIEFSKIEIALEN